MSLVGGDGDIRTSTEPATRGRRPRLAGSAHDSYDRVGKFANFDIKFLLIRV